jgi:hypothetical protein
MAVLKHPAAAADARGMRSLVLAYVGIVWGGVVVGYGLARAADGTTYAPASVAAFAVGCLLFVGGGLVVVLRGRSQ